MGGIAQTPWESRKLSAAVRGNGPPDAPGTVLRARRIRRNAGAVGHLAAEFCPRPGDPPDDPNPDRRQDRRFRKIRFAVHTRPLVGTLVRIGP